MYIIQILGPYDMTYVGPFQSREQAESANEQLHDRLDANVFNTSIELVEPFPQWVTEYDADKALGPTP